MERRSKLSFSSDVEQKQALKSDAENGLRRTVSKEFTPPDGGWGWVVCFTSMLCNGTVFSIMNTFGILYTFLLDEYAAGDSEISLKTSFVGSVSTGLTFLMSIVSSILSDRVGIRQTAFVGTLFGLVGLVSSAFVTELELLYLTFGVFLGIGAGLIYSPSLTILGHYFDKHMGLVNGIVAFGSSLFSIILSIALPYLLKGIQVKYTFIVLAGMYLILVFCTLTWKPLIPKQSNLAALTLSKESVVEHVNDCCAFAKTFLNTKIFKNKAYVIWAVSLGLSLFGYFVPFVHLVKHTKDLFPGENGAFLITCTQITSAIGRLVFGKVADLKFVNRITMQQVAFLVMGVTTACIPFSSSFGGLIAISLVLGLSDGVFVCLIGPIAFDIVGQYQASQAIGFLLGIFAIPFTIGPPVAGALYDSMGSYKVAFHAAGAPPILGAILMFLIPKVKQVDKSHYPAATEAETFASISLLDIHHVSSQHFRDQIEKYKTSSGGGPAETELELVHASQIWNGEKTSGQSGNIDRSLSTDDNENQNTEEESQRVENHIRDEESYTVENQEKTEDIEQLLEKDMKVVEDRFESNIEAEIKNRNEITEESEEKQKLLSNVSQADSETTDDNLSKDILKSVGISEA